MKRIHILGASGSGVSTLGQKLSEQLQIPVFDADTYFWKKTNPPFTQDNEIPERHRLFSKDLEGHDTWIITGSMDSWGAPFEKYFTHIVFNYAPAEIRVNRLKSREKERHHERILEGGDMHKAHFGFLEWAAQYDQGLMNGRSLKKHELWLQKQTTPILRLDSSLELSTLVEKSLFFLNPSENLQRRKTVRAIVLDSKGRSFFVQHREKNTNDLGKWASIGGGLEPSDKSHEDCLRREIAEEFGPELLNQIKIGPFLFKSIWPNREDYFYLIRFQGDSLNFIDHNEIMSARWFEEDELSSMKFYHGFEAQLVRSARLIDL